MWQEPDGSVGFTATPQSTWRGDIDGSGVYKDINPVNTSGTQPIPLPAPTYIPRQNYNQNRGASARATTHLQWWYALLIPPFTPIGLTILAVKAIYALVCLANENRKMFGIIVLLSATIWAGLGIRNMRQIAVRRNGYPLFSFSLTKILMPVKGHPGKLTVEIYHGNNFGDGLARTICSLAAIPHQDIFVFPAIVNGATLENERVIGWDLFKVNNGSVKNSTIVVKNGEIVIVGSVTHSILKAKKVTVKGKLSADSTVIILKP